MSREVLVAAAAVLGSLSFASSSFAQSYGISQDTYIDSAEPNYNAGVYNKVKAVDNPASSQYPGSTSTTRVLFYLPTGFWTTVANAVAAGTPIQDATVNYYPVNNSLSGYTAGAHVNGPNPRRVELHPLDNTWTVGTANYAASTSGATWDTSNGTTPWTNTTEFPTTTYTSNGNSTSYATNVGGDYDVNNYVLDENDAPSGYFTWDITSLLNNPTTRSELQTYGALLKINNDTTYDTSNDIQYFVSLDSADATSNTPFATISVPEPASVGMIGLAAGGLAIGRRKRRI
jgi:hypothetical protein